MTARILQTENSLPARADRLPRKLAYTVLAAMSSAFWTMIVTLIYAVSHHR
jgi:hypothetical protein